jgi:hypothetical protein
MEGFMKLKTRIVYLVVLALVLIFVISSNAEVL